MNLQIADVTHALERIRATLAPGDFFRPEDLIAVLGLPATPDYLDAARQSLKTRPEVEPVTVGLQYWKFR